MKKEELISVVIPVYNVEKCIERCLNSVVNQTYKNLEILLINDGSTDDSGKICDEWANRDDRIKVTHKINGGLSDARNVGIEQAKGLFIGFVDSDDYIDKDMFQILYNALKENNADISICNVKKENEKAELLESCDEEAKKIFDKKEALKLLIKDEIKSYAWNKLYKIELFKEVKYPVGKNMEDVATTYKLFAKSEKIVFDGRTYYHYVNRNDSILHRINKKLILDWIFSLNQRYDDLIEKDYDLKEILTINKLQILHLLFKYYYEIDEKDQDINETFDSEYEFFRKNYKIYKKNIKTSVKNRLETTMLYTSRNIFKFYVAIIKKMKYRN